MRRATGALAALLGLAVLGGGRAHADDRGPRLAVYGYVQCWFTAYEQMDALAGTGQSPSGDHGSDVASGFRLNAARLGLAARTRGDRFGVAVQLRLEDQPGILDLHARATLARWLSFYVGQLKIPSTWENLQENYALDFLTRTRIGEALSDYALSRTTYASSLFYGNSSAQRDLGVGLKGEVRPGGVPLRYFAMVGNGLGANLFIGGATAREYVLSNRPFHFFYGARAEVEPLPGVLALGGHGSYNRHDNIVFNSGRAVLDLDRVSWSADARLTLRRLGLRAAASYGGGRIRDDTYDTHRTDFAYAGWEGRVIWRLNPALRRATPSRRWRDHALEVAFRYDALRTEADESGVVLRKDTYTAGLNYLYRDLVKLQLDVLLRRNHDPTQVTPPSDAVILGLQVRL